jgi:hypothetical protein
MSFFSPGGILLSAPAVSSGVGKDLGEYGSTGQSSGGGAVFGSSGRLLPSNTTVGNYWARSGGVLFPVTIGDNVAINQFISSYNARLSVNGAIFSTGYLLSDSVYVTKDSSDNMVFTDVVSGSKTLADLLATGGGDVMAFGTPVDLQLAQWTNDHTIQGIDISSLTLTQSQITGLVTALANKASLVHDLIDTVHHPVSGLTPGYVLTALSPTTYGFAVAGGGGLTPTDNILEWSVTNSWYTPYSTKAAGKLDRGTVDPTNVDRLNYDGYFYSTKLYSQYLSTEAGSLKHLTVSAGNAYGAAGTDAGDLILKAGNGLSLDEGSTSGLLWLVPGNYYFSGGPTVGRINLGDYASTFDYVYFECVGMSTDIGLSFFAKGSGLVNFITSGTMQFSGSVCAICSPLIQLGGGFETDVIIQNTQSYNVNGYNLTINGSNAIVSPVYLTDDLNGGDIHINGGLPANAGTVGKIYLGTGSAGTNPLPAAGGSDTYMLTYNPTTGQISCMEI